MMKQRTPLGVLLLCFGKAQKGCHQTETEPGSVLYRKKGLCAIFFCDHKMLYFLRGENYEI